MERAVGVDALLMRRLAKGESRALELLYDRYGRRAFGFAIQICRRRELAEEAVQSTFVTVWEKRHLFNEQRAEFAGWFFAILRNRCFDLLRREGREPVVDLSDRLLPDRNEDVEESVERALVRKAVEALPPAYREVILLAYFGGYTHTQLAERLGIPLGTVKSRIRIGLERLARQLGEGGSRLDL